MEKMFYKNRNLRELNSKISLVDKSSGINKYKFEDTIFFPGGGGQISDSGHIEIFNIDGSKTEIKVKEIVEKNNEIFHVLEKEIEIPVGTEIKEVLDWKRREDSMNQHTGQHILSGCIYKKFGRNTKGLHIGKEISQLDIEGEFNDEMVYEIEEFSNKIISDGINIKNYVLEDVRNIETRRPLPEGVEKIRILEIPGLDINACCGVHCTNTRDLKMIKIKRYYKHKDGTRFEYLVGDRAINYVLMRDKVFTRVLNKFNCGEFNVENAINNLELKNEQLNGENKFFMENYIKNLYMEIIKLGKKNNDGIKIILKSFKNENEKIVKEIAKRISEKEKAIVIFGNKKESSNHILIQCSKELSKEYDYIDNGNLIKKMSNNYEIRGGGSPFMAQGSLSKEKNIDNLLYSIYDIYIKK